jgi:hypothetical protein
VPIAPKSAGAHCGRCSRRTSAVGPAPNTGGDSTIRSDMPFLGNEKPTLPQARKAFHAGAFRASRGNRLSTVEPGETNRIET